MNHPSIWQRLVDAWARPDARSLPTDSEFRKDIPVASGFNRYFPAAVVAIAAWSKAANDKHNPGEPLHWARGKSMDQDDCLARHDLDLADAAAHGGDQAAAELEEATCAAWRANARLQLLCERLGAPLAPNARLPLDEAPVQAAPSTPERWIVEFWNSSGWSRSCDCDLVYASENAALRASKWRAVRRP